MPKPKKRHHYAPVSYLTQFSDEAGRLWAYRKDEPYKALHVRPSEIAFEPYYYSQSLDGDDPDDNTIEDFFNHLKANYLRGSSG